MERTLIAALACLALAPAAARAADLTPAQRAEAVRIDRDVNRRFAHSDADSGRGLCWWLARQKLAALTVAGIPASLRDVESPRGLHELVDVPGLGALDMNSDWPEDPAEQRRMGYSPE